MKYFIFTLLLVFIGLEVNAQTWLWAKSAVGASNDKGYDISTDANGNVYMTGSFTSSTITFGSTTLTNANLGFDDFFIVKYDADGVVLWAKSAGGTSDDGGKSISTDASGNVYVTGSFKSSTITFGSTTLTNAGNDNFFIVKYDASGEVLWAKSAGGSNIDAGYGISTDANGNVYVTGKFIDSITFGSITLINDDPFPSADFFIVKYNASGAALWAKTAEGTSYDEGKSISTDASGNVYVTGSFFSPTITFGSTTLVRIGARDLFSVKYNTDGDVLWAKSAGGTLDDFVGNNSVDANGNLYVTGSFFSPTITFGSTTLNNEGVYGYFIVKYDANGTVLWVKGTGSGSSGNVGGNGISTDASGNVYVTGYFQNTNITFGSTTLLNYGGADLFVVKYDASGEVLWAKSAVGTNNDEGNGVTTDASGNVYVTGYFESLTITFGSTLLTKAGGYDFFVAKLNQILTGIEELQGISLLNVAPNPFSTQTTLQTDNFLHNATLTVYNSYGHIVKQIENIYGQSIVLTRDNLVSGLYFIHLTEENKNIVEYKLVITD